MVETRIARLERLEPFVGEWRIDAPAFPLAPELADAARVVRGVEPVERLRREPGVVVDEVVRDHERARHRRDGQPPAGGAMTLASRPGAILRRARSA